MPQDRAAARVGYLEFPDEFADPFVDVESRVRTSEHETISDEFYVQVLGRRPDRITVEGVIWDYLLDDADSVAKKESVTVRTERWTGVAAPERVSTSFRREAGNANGLWAYDVTIELIEIDESVVSQYRRDYRDASSDTTSDEDAPGQGSSGARFAR